jgi:hypothetical protein
MVATVNPGARFSTQNRTGTIYVQVTGLSFNRPLADRSQGKQPLGMVPNNANVVAYTVMVFRSAPIPPLWPEVFG